jgi:hypothetical protein
MLADFGPGSSSRGGARRDGLDQPLIVVVLAMTRAPQPAAGAAADDLQKSWVQDIAGHCSESACGIWAFLVSLKGSSRPEAAQGLGTALGQRCVGPCAALSPDLQPAWQAQRMAHDADTLCLSIAALLLELSGVESSLRRWPLACSYAPVCLQGE